MIITDIFAKIYSSNIIVDAVLTSVSKDKKITIIINILVNNIAFTGVLDLLLTFPKKDGSRLSWLMAMGLRDEAIIPAFAVEKKARSAAIESRYIPGLPAKAAAPSLIGVRVKFLGAGIKRLSPNAPTVTKTTNT